MTEDLEKLIQGCQFGEVKAVGLEEAEIEGKAFVVFTAYLFAEAGPYVFYYPKEISLPVVVTRSERTLIVGVDSRALITLAPAPGLPERLAEHGYAHYADARGL